jgi:hypothetical protein
MYFTYFLIPIYHKNILRQVFYYSMRALRSLPEATQRGCILQNSGIIELKLNFYFKVIYV